MPDFRVFHSAHSEAATSLTLSADESHHLVAVNRARTGDLVVAFDGTGREWDCRLSEASKRAAILSVSAVRTATPRPFEITLAQAIPKGPCMDAIVRKATEIGTRRIIPLLTERTQVHLDGDRQDKKTDKWQTAALEAAKQCGNPWLPEITVPQSFTSFLEQTHHFDLKLIASLQPGAKSLKAILAETQSRLGHLPRHAVWLVGPEGDFTQAETKTAITSGFHPISLGPLVLRCETAAIYALSVLSHELVS